MPHEHEKYSKQIIHAPDTKGALDTIWELAGWAKLQEETSSMEL